MQCNKTTCDFRSYQLLKTSPFFFVVFSVFIQRSRRRNFHDQQNAYLFIRKMYLSFTVCFFLRSIFFLTADRPPINMLTNYARNVFTNQISKSSQQRRTKKKTRAKKESLLPLAAAANNHTSSTTANLFDVSLMNIDFW